MTLPRWRRWRHNAQPSPDQARNRPRALCLCDAAFRQSRAGQHFDWRDGERPRYPEVDLAIAAGRRDPLRFASDPHEPRLLGAVRAAAIPLDSTRGDPTCPRPLHPIPVDQSRDRHPPRAQPIWDREGLCAGTGGFLGQLALARLARTMSPEHVGAPAQNAVLLDERTHILAFLALALAATLSARAFRQWREHRVGSIRLTYPDRTIRVARGFSVLEASLINSIPHAHVCGGRGRCSTCRIRVLGDVVGLPVPSAAEQAVLDRVHAAPGVRLACQLRPTRDIALVPMLSPYATTVDAYRTGAVSSGVERYVVIMFVDMRGSSRLAGRGLPFDTVFIINHFLNAVSSAGLNAGGEPNQVLGDGLLALFGMGDPPDVACRQAIAASAAIAARVESLNTALTPALLQPIRL